MITSILNKEEDYNDEDYYQGIGIPELGNAARTQTASLSRIRQITDSEGLQRS